MGADFLSSAADVFWGRDAWEEGVMSGESEDEGDVVLPGGVSAGVYAQRVLRLMKRWGRGDCLQVHTWSPLPPVARYR